MIVGTQDIYNEQGQLVSSTPIHSDLLEAKKAQVMYCFNLVESFACDKFPPRDREHYLALLARIQLMRSNNSENAHISTVAIIAENWLKFGEDCLVLFEELKNSIFQCSTVEEVITIAPDFSTIYIPNKASVGSLISLLRQ